MSEFPVNDNEFQDDVIAKVSPCADNTGWGVEKGDGWSFFIPPESPVVPTVGMKIRLYGKGIGSPVRGLYLNEQKVFYRTEAEDKEKHLSDTYGSTGQAWLDRWDAGDNVWSISMGGLGPGYEQAIQITVAEILRHLLEAKYNMSRLTDKEYRKEVGDAIDKYAFANPVIDKLGLSGAQFAAARYLAIKLLLDGPIKTMQDEAVADRHIQVQKNFPQG